MLVCTAAFLYWWVAFAEDRALMLALSVLVLAQRGTAG